MAENEGLLSMLECPICYEYMIPPIYQCLNQHLLCSKCKPTQNICPICRGNLDGSRNLNMEKMTEFVAYPCKHQRNGCKEFYLLKEKTKHEEECRKSDNWFCSLLSSRSTICKWVGTFEDCEQHIISEHRSCIKVSADGHFSFNNDVEEELIICHEEKMFLIRVLTEKIKSAPHFQRVRALFFHIILLTCNQGDTYKYDVKVKERHERFEGLVSSITDRVDLRIAGRQNDCLHFMANKPSYTFEGNCDTMSKLAVLDTPKFLNVKNINYLNTVKTGVQM